MANKNTTNISLLLRDVSTDPTRNIQLVSLDCWGTLLTMKDDFWDDFAELFRQHFTPSSELSNQEILSASKRVGREIDAESTKSGKDIPAHSRIAKTLRYLDIAVAENVVERFTLAVSRLLETNEYITVLDTDVKVELAALRNRGIRIILASNTGLISGEQTKTLLKRAGLFTLFDEIYMSDEIGYAKPSKHFFNHIYAHASNTIDTPLNCIHIGDDPQADYYGAIKSGWSASLVPYLVNFSALADSSITPDTYSKFKFGHTQSVDTISDMLLSHISQHYTGILESESLDIVVNYHIIPSASTLLARTVKLKIDEQRLRLGLSPSGILRLNRISDDLDSYGNLPYGDRLDYIFEPSIVDDSLSSGPGTPAIVIDDSYASGSYTQFGRNTLPTDREYYFVYAKRIHTSSGITEDELNHYAIKTLDDLATLYKTEDIQPTRKTYKLILGTPIDNIFIFLQSLDRKGRGAIYRDLVSAQDELNGSYAEKATIIVKYIQGLEV